MALNVTLYEFKKRENSTKRPDASVTQKTHEARLKATTSLLHPVLTFDFTLKGNPSFYNYAYISDFGNRYYYIRDWTVEEGHIWRAQLDVDPLASWKNSIGESTQYVLRSSADYDGGITDTLYPAKNAVTTALSILENPFTLDLAQGTYVVGIVNNADGGIGAAHYYIFSQNTFNKLCAYLLGDPSWTGITDISNDLTKALLNPMQYIVSCNWFPLALPGSDGLSAIPVGWWSIPVAGAKIPTYTVASAKGTLTIPKHPQATRGSYLNGSPYTKYQLFYPGIGYISLPANNLANDEKIRTELQIDIIANTARLSVISGNPDSAEPISVTYGQIGVPIQLSQMSTSFFQNLGGVVQSAAQFATSYSTGNIAGMITGGLSAIGNALDASYPDVSISGLNGSLLALKTNIILKATFYNIADEDNADKGRPLCKTKELSTLPGYQLISHADIAIAGTSEENRAIKNYLESGYFYE